MPTLINDMHSQLNATLVAEICHPETYEELREIILKTGFNGMKISVGGGRHAMGGQQFAYGSVHIDMTALDKVLDVDHERGLLHIEAGACWPKIIEESHCMEYLPGKSWAIRQKQTGVDNVTLGGSISANAHGRGLRMQPMGDDIEDLTVLDAEGRLLRCSRSENSELFSLVIGGYGLFGIIYSATLRLTSRLRVRRLVDIIDLADAMNAVYRRAADGSLYGDFQFIIDPRDSGFLRRGVFASYKSVESDEFEGMEESSDLSPNAWLELLKLAHEDKAKAFRLYAQHYVASDGNLYWSDTMQLSTYIPSYAEYLEANRPVAPDNDVKETLMIGEHYIPPESLLTFMHIAREILIHHGAELIYGTIRSIKRDTVSFMPWAKNDFACVIFNLRTRHNEEGVQRTTDTFRALIDASVNIGGSFFLTYHRYATAAQVQACYPLFSEWLCKKIQYDPNELFISDWYLHYRDAFHEGVKTE
jgi:FAD/FMN-containing dehydrogenase